MEKKKRNTINEILDKNQFIESKDHGFKKIYERIFRISLLEDFFHENYASIPEVGSTREALQKYDSAFIEGIQYIPVGLVACIESYYRLIITHLIDSSVYYKEKASKFDIKFSIQTAIDLELNKLSTGQFISHLIRVNNLNDINSNMSQIMGENYLSDLKNWRDKLDDTLELFPLSRNEKNTLLINKIQSLFNFRHKIAHEPYVPIDDKDISELLSFSKYVANLLQVTDKYVEAHISANKNVEKEKNVIS